MGPQSRPLPLVLFIYQVFSLLNLTLNEKSLAHSLQFGSKYHVYSDSRQAQITEHKEYNYVKVALYYVGKELENLMRTDRQRINKQTENSKSEATLIPVDHRGERANILRLCELV